MCQNINPEKEAVYCLDDGKVFIDYGPVSMVVTAKKDGKMQTDLARESFYIVREALRELAGQLGELRKFPTELCGEDFEGLPRNMVEAVKSTGEPTLTPMAAVAEVAAEVNADAVGVSNLLGLGLELFPRVGKRLTELGLRDKVVVWAGGRIAEKEEEHLYFQEKIKKEGIGFMGVDAFYGPDSTPEQCVTGIGQLIKNLKEGGNRHE